MLTKKQRLEYFFTTFSVFISGFFIYGIIGSLNSEPNSFWTFGLLGGLGFSMILSSVILAVSFFKRKSFSVKLIASLLWPITLLCIFFVGLLSYFPYQIYNSVCIFKMHKREKTDGII